MPSKTTLVFGSLLLLVVMASGRQIVVRNRCSQAINVQTLGNKPRFNPIGQKRVEKGAQVTFNLPQPWAGRLWGDKAGASLFELSLEGTDPKQTQDYYNLSVIDGYNHPMTVKAIGGKGGDCRQLTCKDPNCKDAYQFWNDDRGKRGEQKKPVSGCKGANYEVTFCP